jgi:hypothetical protein
MVVLGVEVMTILERFLAYAGDFERTLHDDDWSRIRKYFHTDAVYEVSGASFACKLQGPEAIFAGIKKSLDGFDRRFDGRDIAVTSGPDVDDDEMTLAWTVTYKKEGWTPFVLRGRSRARYRGDRIAYLGDSYDAAVDDELTAWQRENGVTIDASYV